LKIKKILRIKNIQTKENENCQATYLSLKKKKNIKIK